VLFDSVVNTLQLRESDYFGLEYSNEESMPVCYIVSCLPYTVSQKTSHFCLCPYLRQILTDF